MTTAADQITYWHMVWDTQTHTRGENRTATVSLELPHEVLFRLLVTPTSGLTIQKRAATYFADQAEARFDDVLRYLRAFFARMAETCDLSSPGLAVRSEGRGSEFDFPRPSPSWIMVEEFCRGLRRHRELCVQLKTLPVRWF